MLGWTQPDTIASGAPVGALSGFRIYYGRTSGAYTGSIFVAGGNTIGGTVTGLGTGTWYFTVAAVDAAGNESTFGYELSKTL